MNHHPLSGIRVLEHGGLIAAPYCGRLLAGMGAEVIRVEPPGGDEARQRGPYLHDVPDPETSALFLYDGAGKKSITLDLHTAAGAALFRALAMESDTLVEETAPGTLAAVGLDFPSLRQANPRLVYASVSPFGQSGPYANYKACDLQSFFAGGEGYALPGSLSQRLFPGREPVRAGGYLAERDAGSAAASAVLSGLLAREVSGRGQHLDISKHEVEMALTRESLQKYLGYGEVIDRNRSYFFGGIFQCADGYVTMFPREDRHWESLCGAMGRRDLAEDSRFKEFAGRARHKDLLNGILQEWVRDMPKREVYRLASGAGCPCGYFATAEDVVASEQLAFRGFLPRAEHPKAGSVISPGAPYHMTDTAPVTMSAAPLLGEHNHEVLCGLLGLAQAELSALRCAGVI